MSNKNDEILELLKSITLLEAVDLVRQIEDTFGVDASGCNVPYGSVLVGMLIINDFAVVLEEVPTDKRIGILKVLRSVTDLGLKEAKELVDSVPQIIKEAIAKDEANDIKRQLEAVGAKVSVNQI